MGTPELPVPDGLVLRPFRGVRFAVEDPAKVTSPPYDLISDADVEALLSSHPNNVVRLILPCSPAGDSSSAPVPGQDTEPRPVAGAPSSPEAGRENSHPGTGPASPRPGTGPEGSRTGTAPEKRPGAGPSPQAQAPLGGQPDTVTPLPAQAPLESRYIEARDTLKAWLDSGVLVADDVPALYVYEQSGAGVLQRGLIGDVGLTDPEQRIILPHEDVMPGPVADRLALMSTTQANLEPIFLLYDGANGTATRLVDAVASDRQPQVSARTEDGLTHRLWAITDPEEIAAINADLHDRQALIADGHHRYATYRVLQRQEHESHLQADPAGEPAPDGDEPTPPPTGPAPERTGPAAGPIRPVPEPIDQASQRVDSAGARRHDPSAQVDGAPAGEDGPADAGRSTAGPWDFGLALLVDTSAYPPDLQAIHRVIPGLPLDEAAARAKGSWRVHDYDDLALGLAALETAAEPAFLLAGESGAHLLTDPDPVQLAHAMPPDRSGRWNSLNTSVLSEFVMPKVWGMRDDERTVRIVHHDARAAARLAARSGGTAVILNPLKAEEVLAVAAGGERVPRKSTSFGPKPRTGLVLRTFAID
ncbi:DUF1015 family protein [Nonomuraea sp. B10E15]|uniref:DUF1015 family protein n=1 Tax=Nonomuraea sp. B10E15 TaxID=3153560 RepID=UPI00325F3ED9